MNSEKEQVQFSRFRNFLRKFKKQKTAIAALLVIVLLGVIAVVGERIAPFGIDEFDYSSILQGPSSAPPSCRAPAPRTGSAPTNSDGIFSPVSSAERASPCWSASVR